MITVAELKEYLGIALSDTKKDTFLAKVIPMALTHIESGKVLNRKLASASYSEEIEGKSNVLYPSQLPITAVTDIKEISGNNELSDLLDDPDTIDNTVRFNEYEIKLMKGYTFAGKLIKITYTAGYSDGTLPGAIKQALLETSAYIFKNSGQGDSLLMVDSKTTNNSVVSDTVNFKKLDLSYIDSFRKLNI